MVKTMKQTVWKLENAIKNFDWGSLDQITKVLGISNSTQKPIAEIWMGAHPMGCSQAIYSDNHKVKLDKLINNNPQAILGEDTYKKFAGLPYLFKILSANKALSIQVHPTKTAAECGFEKENELGIALDDPKRNYKDPNHKPELIYALTPFKAMRSFRPISEILNLFGQISVTTLSKEIAQLQNNPNEQQLKLFFQTLLTLSSERKHHAIKQLLTNIASFYNEPYATIKDLANDYPNDIGIFMPLILNVIELQPGQAMFLDAQTPHAYIKGTGLEVMANSDNVLRAGLTHKYIDIEQLIQNTNFDSLTLNNLLIKPIINANKISFPVPVDDFNFEIIYSNDQQQEQKVTSAQIVLCLEGKICLTTEFESVVLSKGESAFIAYQAKEYCYTGEGILAKVSN